MTKYLINVLFLAPLFSAAQNDNPLNDSRKGIYFEQTLTWQEIQAKAKKENKFIFVDCYASWCQPCKMMDRDVYQNDSAGNFVNEHFIAVKMQMDTSKKDDAATKMRYADAHQLMANYKVYAYPTFLFLDANGTIVDRDLGYHPVADFVKITQHALDPDKQYYTLLEAYQNGHKDFAHMSELAKMTAKFGDKTLSQQIAADYMHGYLDHLREKEFLEKPNQEFIGQFAAVVTTKDRIFQLCLHHRAVVDAASEKGGSFRFVSYILYKEEFISRIKEGLQTGVEPDWKRIKKNVTGEYGAEYVPENMINAKINWYLHRKDGQHYTKYFVQKMEKQFKETGIPKDDPQTQLFTWNNSAFEVFKYNSDKNDLKTALSWIERVNQMREKPDAGCLDTQANILYKLGKKGDALKMETQANLLNPNDKEIAGDLQKMQAGQPTWPLNGMQ